MCNPSLLPPFYPHGHSSLPRLRCPVLTLWTPTLLFGLQHSVLGSLMPGCFPPSFWALTAYTRLPQDTSLPSSDSDPYMGQPSWVATLLLWIWAWQLVSKATVVLSFQGQMPALCLPHCMFWDCVLEGKGGGRKWKEE